MSAGTAERAATAETAPLGRRGLLRWGALAGGGALLAACGSPARAAEETSTESGSHEPITDPAVALQELQDGNARFVAGRVEHPAQSTARRAEVAEGQHPFAAVLSCADSRVPPELVFDRGLGDLFVVRTAGQVVADPVLGSIQYGVEHLHVPLLVVLGHSGCGAVKATLEAVQQNAPASGTGVDSLVEAIRPAAQEALGTAAEASRLDVAVRLNVENIVASLGADPVLAAAVTEGRLRIVGATYSLEDGAVTFL